MKSSKRKLIALVLLVVVGGAGYWVWAERTAVSAYKTKYEKDVYVRLNMEIYDTVVKNYWQKVDEKELAELYRLSLAKAINNESVILKTQDRTGVAEMLAEGYSTLAPDKRKEIALNTGIIILANLAPQGRSGLLSEQQETAFRDNVNNVNRERNLYESLGLADKSDIESVERAYEEKKKELENDPSPEAQEKLQEVLYAREVLADAGSKAIYDETQSEPTLISRKMASGAVYLDLSKISNTTLQEVANNFAQYSDENPPKGLIIDLRGNTGGALDFAKYFLSFFLGPNQYAYDLFQQGEYHPERTPKFAKVGYLSDLNDVAVLVDGVSQSTSELLAASFKRFRLGKIVGTQSKGWGTVENTFPLETTLGDGNKYSVLLVHSLTLRDDGEPIEGRGVDPDINIENDGWQSLLSDQFESKAFITDLVRVVGQ